MTVASKPSRAIALIGPPGVGKTTLAAALAGLEGGAVEDSGEGLVRCLSFPYIDEQWVSIDCPGAADLAQATSDVLQVVDAAVVVVSPDPAAAVLAAPHIRLVQSCGVPLVVFINRIRESQGRVRDIVSGLQHFSNGPLVVRQVPVREGDEVVGAIDLISERAWRYRPGQRSDLVEIPAELRDAEAEARFSLLETMSDFDEGLLEQIIEDRVPPCDTLFTLCKRLLAEGATVPVFFGDAAEGHGINRLMKALRHEVPALEKTVARIGDTPLAGVFHAHYQKHLGKVCHVRALAGTLKPAMPLGGAKLGQILSLDGAKGQLLDAVAPGAVAKIVKTEQLNAGTLYDADGPVAPARPAPVLEPQANVTIAARNSKDEVRLSEALHRLAQDDRALTVSHDEDSGTLLLSGQGDLHFRQVADALKADFGIEVRLGEPRPSYRETIAKSVDVHYRHKKQSGGSGQFADIKFTVTPAPRGSGFSFEETIHGGSVPRQYIPSVEEGMRQGLEKGPLGFPVTDLHVRLTDGQHHSVDSSDIAFKIAGQMGIREALEQAGSVLLEPMYEVSCHVPDSFTGALNPRIAVLHGQVLGFERDPEHEGWEVLKVMLPGQSLHRLLGELRGATQGTGRFEARFSHYQEVYGREAEAVLQSS